MVMREDVIIHFFQERDALCILQSNLFKSVLNDMAFPKCSDICAFHVCKEMSSFDQFQFQAFPHFLPGLQPEVK